MTAPFIVPPLSRGPPPGGPRREIPVVAEADVESFVKRGKPFVVRGHSAVRRLEPQLSFDSLAAKLSGTIIDLSHRLCWVERRRRVDAARFLRHVGGSQYYWRNIPLNSFGLKPALPEPAGRGPIYFDHGWVGPKDCVQTFHQDNHDQLFLNHNMFIQVTGRKYVALASPLDSDFFLGRPAVEGNTRQSAASPWDESVWEGCGTLAETLLEAGDMVYMPPRTWHFVRSYSTSISISRWWFTNRLASILYACDQRMEVDPISDCRENRSRDWAADLAAFGGWPVVDAFLKQIPLMPRLRFELALVHFYGKGVLDDFLSFELADE
ncbi:MAG: hypothetical protein QOH04_2628 [Sphingomonadales bacterium]|nr:hypothetical protein [Sphingomonadales bacterium]MEA3036851.1 hypothetical protein [Sphingomonadales bacterium]